MSKQTTSAKATVKTIELRDVPAAALREQLQCWGEAMTQCSAQNGRLWLLNGKVRSTSDGEAEMIRLGATKVIHNGIGAVTAPCPLRRDDPHYYGV